MYHLTYPIRSVASASDNHRLLAKQLEKLTPQMSMFHTGQLFAAQFVQRVRWNLGDSF